jgi:hypothetical protein
MTPHEIADERVRLAGEYARDTEVLIGLLKNRAVLWAQLRADAKSDKAADRAWEATPLGLEEMALRLRMKASEKQMSALKTKLEVLEGEARNTY